MIIILSIVLNENWKTLSDWLRANKLTVNVDKSVFLMFNRKGKQSINQLKLGDSLINRVSSTKFLGTWVDDQLNWKTPMSRLLSKLKCGLGMLQNIVAICCQQKPRNSCIMLISAHRHWSQQEKNVLVLVASPWLRLM